MLPTTGPAGPGRLLRRTRPAVAAPGARPTISARAARSARRGDLSYTERTPTSRAGTEQLRRGRPAARRRPHAERAPRHRPGAPRHDEALSTRRYSTPAGPIAGRGVRPAAPARPRRPARRHRRGRARVGTLSSADGTLAATVTNGLDEPVTVRIEAVADAPLEVAGSEALELAPGGRNAVLLDVSASPARRPQGPAARRPTGRHAARRRRPPADPRRTGQRVIW